MFITNEVLDHSPIEYAVLALGLHDPVLEHQVVGTDLLLLLGFINVVERFGPFLVEDRDRFFVAVHVLQFVKHANVAFDDLSLPNGPLLLERVLHHCGLLRGLLEVLPHVIREHKSTCSLRFEELSLLLANTVESLSVVLVVEVLLEGLAVAPL